MNSMDIPTAASMTRAFSFIFAQSPSSLGKSFFSRLGSNLPRTHTRDSKSMYFSQECWQKSFPWKLLAVLLLLQPTLNVAAVHCSRVFYFLGLERSLHYPLLTLPLIPLFPRNAHPLSVSSFTLIYRESSIRGTG